MTSSDWDNIEIGLKIVRTDYDFNILAKGKILIKKIQYLSTMVVPVPVDATQW